MVVNFAQILLIAIEVICKLIRNGQGDRHNGVDGVDEVDEVYRVDEVDDCNKFEKVNLIDKVVTNKMF